MELDTARPSIRLPDQNSRNVPSVSAVSRCWQQEADVMQSDALVINLLMFTEFFQHTHTHTGHVETAVRLNCLNMLYLT